MSAPSSGSLELTIILSVARLGDEAYGLEIRRDVSARTRRDYSVGAVYTTLQRLQGKGLLSSHTTEPLPQRGGRSRRQFQLTASGRKALVEARRTAATIWTGVGMPVPARSR